MDAPSSWLIVGAGRAGRLMGLIARDLGVRIAGTWNQGAERADETARVLGMDSSMTSSGALPGALGDTPEHPLVVFVTVVDDAVQDVASRIAPWLPSGSLVVHLAGSLSSSVLRDAGVAGDCLVASLHPLLAVADPHAARRKIDRVTWTLEGDDEAVRALRAWMAEVDVHPLSVRADRKALYHASAVTAANLLVGLMDAAYAMAEAAGISEEQARRDMLVPLARSCVENLAVKSPRDALTGPVARGDWATVERHEDALREVDEELLEIYALLTRRAKRVMSE